jgi:hypothetical protein
MNEQERKPEPADGKVALGARSSAEGLRVGVGAVQRPGTEQVDPAEADVSTPEPRDAGGEADGS